MVDEVSRSAARLAALIAVPVALLTGVGAFALLTGVPADPPEEAASPAPVTSGPVATAARELTGREQTVCRALLSQLPGTVRELAQRPVTAGPEQNAAYGDPPITVSCGVPAPEVAPTDRVWDLDGVCWYVLPGDGPGTTLVTVDREVPVRLDVPDGYDAPGQWAAEFADPIVASVLSVDAPTGCRR